jgi:hypothetical protein
MSMIQSVVVMSSILLSAPPLALQPTGEIRVEPRLIRRVENQGGAVSRIRRINRAPSLSLMRAPGASVSGHRFS